MKTQIIKYSEAQIGDKIFTNGRDNHMFRKLNFQEIEIVSNVEKYLSNGAGKLIKIDFESKNATLGIFDRNLERILE